MRLVYQDKAHRLHVTFNELERRLATYELDVDPHKRVTYEYARALVNTVINEFRKEVDARVEYENTPMVLNIWAPPGHRLDVWRYFYDQFLGLQGNTLSVAEKNAEFVRIAQRRWRQP